MSSTASPKTFACVSPFCPVVASSTKRISSTAAPFSTTRRTLPNSFIKSTLVCKRPAVSTRTKSAPLSLALFTASKAMAAGSPPGPPVTISAPARCAQVSTCSVAAARKVSAAAMTTRAPSSTARCASLPTLVVFPAPFTPTMSTTPAPDTCTHNHIIYKPV